MCIFVSETYAIEDCFDTILGTSEQLSKFSSSIGLRNNGSGTISYDSTNHYYKWQITTNNSESMIPINNATGHDDFIIEFDGYQNAPQSACGITLYKDTNNWDRLSISNATSTIAKKVNGTFTETESSITSVTSKWLHYKYIISNNTFTKQVYDGDTLINTVTETLDSSWFSSTTKYGIPIVWNSVWSNQTFLKNFKIKPL